MFNRWWLLLILLSAVDGLYHFGFELCSSEKAALFYEETLPDDRSVAFISPFDCQEDSQEEMDKSDWTVTRCRPNNSHVDLHFKGAALDEFLRVGHGRLALCQEDKYAVDASTAVRRLQRQPKCHHYEPQKTDPIRVYLVCDGRLHSSPVLLIVTSAFHPPYDGHLIEGAFWGWHIGLFFVVLPTAVYFILREIRLQKKAINRGRLSK